MQSFMAFILSLNEAVQVGSWQAAAALCSPCSTLGDASLTMQAMQNSTQFQEQAATLKAGTGGARCDAFRQQAAVDTTALLKQGFRSKAKPWQVG